MGNEADAQARWIEPRRKVAGRTDRQGTREFSRHRNHRSQH